MIRFIALALIMISSPAWSQSLDERAQSLVESGSPGAVAMLGVGEDITISVAGVRAIDSNVQIELDDLWHIGSNTKAMTAMLVARLVEQDVISWEDTIGQHLGEAIPDIRADYADVTFVELLSHRSGLPPNAGLMTLMSLSGADANRDDVADRLNYARSVLTKNPGGERGAFLYSNSGYIVAGAMLEAATGEGWRALMTREVFEPLGLESAGFGPPGVGGAMDQPRGHRPGLLGGMNAIEPGSGQADNPPALGPAGRVHISMRDYATFLRAVIAGANGDDGDYLGTESWERLLTPVGDSYALGWGVMPNGALAHAGSNTMWFLQAVIWPDERRFVVLGVNNANMSRVPQAMAPIIEALGPEGGRD